MRVFAMLEPIPSVRDVRVLRRVVAMENDTSPFRTPLLGRPFCCYLYIPPRSTSDQAPPPPLLFTDTRLPSLRRRDKSRKKERESLGKSKPETSLPRECLAGEFSPFTGYPARARLGAAPKTWRPRTTSCRSVLKPPFGVGTWPNKSCKVASVQHQGTFLSAPGCICAGSVDVWVGWDGTGVKPLAEPVAVDSAVDMRQFVPGQNGGKMICLRPSTGNWSRVCRGADPPFRWSHRTRVALLLGKFY
ncbi:hypothetical protein VTK73DRAFT_589 [Phialemonium thermophilum]|uniref:Uncharacterized protein n=1 Tax=Phialemonium thermophilum TaxID=223376 RepID=A0ABR3VUN0_9PEZI